MPSEEHEIQQQEEEVPQFTKTTRLGLFKPTPGSTDWGGLFDANWEIIDALFGRMTTVIAKGQREIVRLESLVTALQLLVIPEPDGGDQGSTDDD